MGGTSLSGANGGEFGNVPLYFVPNQGQVDGQALFYSKTPGYTLWLTQTGMVFDGRQKGVSQMVFLNATKDVQAFGGKPSGHRVNYIRGRDSKNWHTNIPSAGEVTYKGIYRDIDLKIYGVEKQIEYDWIIKPGGDPGQIAFKFDGIKKSHIDNEGNLVIESQTGQWVHKKPVAYQVLKADRENQKRQQVSVKADFNRLSDNSYGFQVGDYDPRYELVIDPLILSMFSYLGGSGDEDFQDIQVDGTGVYVCGATYSLDFPLASPLQGSFGGERDVIVAKLTLDGTGLIYSTYIGGNDEEYCGALAIDGTGAVYIGGHTGSTDFPTANPYQGSKNGTQWDGFISKLSADGSSLLYSTYFGGAFLDHIMDLKLGSGGEIFVTGRTQSDDFPLVNAYQSQYGGGEGDGFIAKFAADGQSLFYSTLIGGSYQDFPYALEVDGNGNAYIGGFTQSADYPAVNAFQSVKHGGEYEMDGFVTKFSADGSALVFSTFLGGSKMEMVYDIALDTSGAVYVGGTTESLDYPVTPGAYQQTKLGGDNFLSEGYVAKLAASGSSLEYATYISGPDFGEFTMFAPLPDGTVYVTGSSFSADYPVVNSFVPWWATPAGAVLTRISADGSSLLSSTFIRWPCASNAYALALDGNGAVYITGMAGNCNNGYQGFQEIYGGSNSDGFVAKLEESALLNLTVTSQPTDETWVLGSEQTITWTAPATMKTVDITLYIPPGTETIVAEDISNTGSFQWTVSGETGPGGFLSVTDGSEGGWMGDDADGLITISPPLPSVEVTSPNGGEELIMKQIYTITWNSSNLQTGYVNLYWSPNNGILWNRIGTGPVVDSGSYNWTVPMEFSKECLIKVEDEYMTIWDESNAVFTIRSSTISQAERNALIWLYNETQGDYWTNNTNWRKPGDPMQFNDPGTEGTWFGVTLTSDNRHVEKLELEWNNLTGYLPPELNDLTYLRILDMDVNQISGSLPDLSNLSQLIWLQLGSNQLSGTLPAWLNNMTSLLRIHLRNNQFTGPIPDLSNLTNLISLGLGWNQLTGPVPAWLNSLTSIYSLDLEYNDLSGPLPDLSGMSALKFLYLTDNQLTGAIPAWFNTLTLLEYFKLGRNQFTGDIPDLSALTAISVFELHSNQLTGPMPPWLNSLTNLQRIDLSNNQLSGTIPSLTGIAQLRYLWLYNNKFSGNIPADIGDLTTLYYLQLHGNNLVGELPSSMINLTNLYPALNNGLDISYNGLYTSDDTLRNFLNSKHTNGVWENTQTVAPKGLAVDSVTHDSITLTWYPIQYSGDSGRYKIFYSPSAGGGYTLIGTTGDKAESTFTLNNLTEQTTYYFMVQTVTDTHASNQNSVVSEYTPVVSGTTLVKPRLVLVSPAPGEDLAAGGVYNITWSTTGTVANISLEFSSDNGFNWAPVVTDVPNEERYSWTVPIIDSGYCLLRISDSLGIADPDVTDGVFGVWKDSSITVLSPNGGEQLTGGAIRSITWNNTGKIEDVMIEYTVTAGRRWLLVESSIPNTGMYQWTVPNVNKNKCKVRVTAVGVSAQDASDGLFTIKSN